MAIHLERSGGLYLIKGDGRDDPEEPKDNKFVTLGLWLMLIGLAAGVLFAGPHSLTMADISHTFKGFLTAAH